MIYLYEYFTKENRKSEEPKKAFKVENSNFIKKF